MSWLGVIGRAAWDVIGHPTEANPGEDKYMHDVNAAAAAHQQQIQQHQEQQHHDSVSHHDAVSHHSAGDFGGHDAGHSDQGGSGW